MFKKLIFIEESTEKVIKIFELNENYHLPDKDDQIRISGEVYKVLIRNFEYDIQTIIIFVKNLSN